MTFGLISGLLGNKLGGGYNNQIQTQPQIQTPIQTNQNQFDLNSLASAFNNVYQNGFNAGSAQNNNTVNTTSNSSYPQQNHINYNNHMFGGNSHTGIIPNLVSGINTGSISNTQTGSNQTSAGCGVSHGAGGSTGSTGGPGSTGSSGHTHGTGGSTGSTGGPGSTSGSSGSGELLGGLLDSKLNLLSSLLGGGQASGGGITGNLLSGITGGNANQGSNSGNSGILPESLGQPFGIAAQGVHGLAEKAIQATGLGSVFGPLVDDPIIHPLLWDPISMLTGYDVSKHPGGVEDVSDPLGVRSENSGQSTSGGLLNII